MTDLQREENAAILLSHSQIKPEFLTHSGTFISDLCEKVLQRVDEPSVNPSDPKYVRKVVAYEYRSNNSTQRTVAKLDCGHERVFEYGTYPKTALCWECPKVDLLKIWNAAPEPEYRPGFCERCGNFREIAKPIGYETGDYEMVPCPECAL